VEYTSNTRNLRRLRRHGIYVDYTLENVRQVDTFQRRIHVDSTSKLTLRLVRWIFYVESTSFYVEKFLYGHGIFLTSIQH